MALQETGQLDLVGGCNFRDLGGYRASNGRMVRRGLVYRSGVLTYHAAHAALLLNG